MLLVSFCGIDSKIENIDKNQYVKNIFSKLESNGYIDSIVVDNSFRNNLVQEVIQEINPGIYKTRHIHKNKNNTEAVIEIRYIWATYKSGIQFSINILSDSFVPSPEEDYVEKLKFAIKSYIKDDWGKIEWLIDKDSECLSFDLYPQIFRTENSIRSMIYELLSKYYGGSWWDTFISYDIKQKYNARKAGYKKAAQGFANIDDHLLSIDVGDLKKIMQLKSYKWKPSFDDNIDLMIKGLYDWNDQKVKDLLSKQSEIVIDFWDKHFKSYLPENFFDVFDVFEANRNHVAHNKLLDRQAYYQIKKNVDEIYNAVTKAIEDITQNFISNEERERYEEEIDYPDINRFMRIENEARIKIRNQEEIVDIFDDAFDDLCSILEESFRFRDDIEIESSTGQISFHYNISDEDCIINARFEINPEEGEESNYIFEDDSDFSDYLVYRNGKAEYDEDLGIYYPVLGEEMPNVDGVAESIISYINEKFPNLRSLVDAAEYRVIKEGGNPQVLEFPCGECGECYIAADDTYAPKGTCLNCGAKYEVHECMRCGIQFIGYVKEDDPEICDNCLDILDKQ